MSDRQLQALAAYHLHLCWLATFSPSNLVSMKLLEAAELVRATLDARQQQLEAERR